MWKRIVLDEAHTICNCKSQISIAVCELKARYRWDLGGTPVYSRMLELYSLQIFLRCSPFDDLIVSGYCRNHKQYNFCFAFTYLLCFLYFM
jgi:transcription termination factor 2